jgi:hypothetical protein
MNKYTLEAARNAGAQEIKNQKAAKAKRIVMGTDAHLRGYQAARKIDNAEIGGVVDFRSQAEYEYPPKHRNKRVWPADNTINWSKNARGWEPKATPCY